MSDYVATWPHGGANRLRIGSSSAAFGRGLSMDISMYTTAGTRRLRALHVRTGDEFTSGSWRIELLDPSRVPLLSWVLPLAPNSWNALVLPQPLSVTSTPSSTYPLLTLRITPVGSAEMEFRAWGFLPGVYPPPNFFPDVLLGDPGAAYTGRLYSRYTFLVGDDGGTLANPLISVTDDGGQVPTGSYQSVLVLESDDRSGPFTPPECADASTEVSGNPYFDMILAAVDSDGGTLTQTLGPVHAPSYDLAVGRFQLESSSTPAGLFETTHNGSIVETGLVTDGFRPMVMGSCLPIPATEDAETYALTLRADGGTFSVYVLSAGLGLGRCDAPARATWGGSGFSFNDEPGQDLLFHALPGRSLPYYRDTDSDGYGDIAQRTYGCPWQGVDGSVLNADDCADNDPAVHPDAGELCNGIDDDCDGVMDAPDPDLVRGACELSLGICAGSLHSTAECLNGSWMACGAADYGATFTNSEVPACDGTDDDCDGVIETTVPCEKQLGVCAGSAHDLCSDAGYCDAPDYGPAYEPFELSCDGLDNDCDGETDEGCATPDAGPMVDGGARIDAGSPDSGDDGLAADGGNSRSQPRGCGCAAVDLSGAAAPLLLCALLRLRRRRR